MLFRRLFSRGSTMKSGAALDWLNVFLADVKDGLGPFLAIYLLSSQQWDATRIGIVMMIAGIATVLARAPFGALVDGTRVNLALIVGAAALVASVIIVVPLVPQFWPVAAGQAMIGAADAVFPPAVAAISLGIVGRGGFTHR